MARRSNLRALSAIGLLLSFAIWVCPLGQWGREYSGLGKLLGSEILWWIVVILMLLFVGFIERRRFSSIGFRRPNWRDLLAAIGAAVLAIVGIALIYAVLFPALHLQLNQGAMQGLLRGLKCTL